MSGEVRVSRRDHHAPLPRPGRPLATAALLLSLSLGGLVRAYALPVEATTRESWYSYQHELGFDYVARVRQGVIYGQWSQAPDQLVRTRLPVEPAAFRRVLVARLTDAVDIRLPYRFTADHPGEMTARFRVDGYMVAPNLWRRPYPLVAEQEYRASGSEWRLDHSIRIPVQQLLADFQNVQAETGLGQDIIELHLRPVVEVDVAGQRHPVQARLAPEFMLVFRGGNIALEIDEPQVISDAQSFSETRVVPLTVRIMGRDVPVATVRSVAMGGLGASCLALLAVAALRWLRRKPGAEADLRRLGAAVIRARSFEIPPGAAVVEVSAVRQLLELHVQTERPVVRVGNTCYLLDGAACYRLTLGDPPPAPV